MKGQCNNSWCLSSFRQSSNDQVQIRVMINYPAPHSSVAFCRNIAGHLYPKKAPLGQTLVLQSVLSLQLL